MLTTLRIKNLALVSDLTLDLQPGYNAITGETGAGKSIIIGALKLLLGERADRTLIRAGSDQCSVEAVFDILSLPNAFRAHLESIGAEPCEENRLILKRSFTAAGANRQFINGSPVSLQALASVGEWLVDMHGPHDHQSLLHPSRQLAILDSLGKFHPVRDNLAQLLAQRADLDAQKSRLVVDEKSYAQQLDLLRFQTNEIKAAKLSPGEEEQVEQEYQRASNAARLLQLAHSANILLNDDEQSLITQTGALGRALQELQKLDPGAAPLLELQQQSASLLNDLQSELASYIDHTDIDPARHQELEERLNLIHSLKRKYGGSLADVISRGETARQQLIELENRDEELIRIKQAQEKINAEFLHAARALSTQRSRLIPKLAKSVAKELSDLGFKRCLFEIDLKTDQNPDFEKRPPSPNGLDTLEFLFAPNPGEPARPLRAIASSGEMARVMLAIKTVLASEDEIPVLVFDEVDANVGGETAHAVGQKMRRIAQQRQVLCITHLAPVAASASAHYLVSKELLDGRTLSEIRLLPQPERITELARMLGGQSEAARKHAESLLAADKT